MKILTPFLLLKGIVSVSFILSIQLMFRFCKVSPTQNDLTVKTASLLFTERSFQCFSLHSEYLPSAHPFHLLLYSDYIHLISLIFFIQSTSHLLLNCFAFSHSFTSLAVDR